MKRIFLFLPFILVVLSACNFSPNNIQCEMDLSDRPLDVTRFECLQGQWEFYPDQLINPTNIIEDTTETSVISVPKNWNRIGLTQDPDTGFYYGTYRLRLWNVSATNSIVFSFSVYKAYVQVWMNGGMVAEYGSFDRQTGDFQPAFGRKSIALDPSTNNYDIYLVMASPGLSHAGIRNRVFLSTAHFLKVKEKAAVFFFFLKFFTMTVMGLYHLMIFAFRRKEKSFLYFGLFTFFLAASYVSYEILEITSEFADYWQILLKLDKIFLFVAIQMIFSFFYFVYSDSKWLKRIKFLGMGLYGSLVLLVLFIPIRYSYSLYSISQFISIGLILLMISSLKKYLFHQGLFKKKDGSTFLFFGFVFLAVSYILEGIFNKIYYVQISVSDLGVILFVFAQALFIARRSVKAFDDVEKMTAQLKSQNLELQKAKDELEERVEERTLELREALEELTVTLEEIKRYQDQIIVQEKLASLGALTAGIAHEIKNPLNFVNNFSTLSAEMFIELLDLLRSPDIKISDRKKEDLEELIEHISANLEKIVHHGKRADNIVKSMLEHSRDKGHDKRPTDVNALLEEDVNLAFHGMRARFSDFNVTTDVQLDTTADKMEVVSADLSRVFLNILNNAFYAVFERSKSSAGYQPEVKVRSTLTDTYLEIRIRDNGPGIPSEIAKNIFNPFFTTKPTGEGNTGLGLSISYDIVVQEHGGTLRFESEPGEFTEFIITLPR